MIYRTTFSVLAAVCLAAIAGCINAPKSGAALHEATATISVQLAQAHATDHAIARGLLAANFATQRVLLTGSVYRGFIVADFIDTAGDANLPAFKAAIADAARAGPLLDDVRIGRLSVDDACQWLADYAAARKIKSARELQDKMLGSLKAVADFDDQNAALLAAFDARWVSIVAAYKEQGENMSAIGAVFDQSPTYDATQLGNAIKTAISSRAGDPKLAASIDRLIDTVTHKQP